MKGPAAARTERGVEPAAFDAEAMRLTQLRLRSVGFLAEEGPAGDLGASRFRGCPSSAAPPAATRAS